MARARMGDVWDSTVQAVGGRLPMILPVAALTLFAPSVVQAAVQAYAPPGVAPRPAVLLVSLALLVITLWGGLAITAMLSSPATTRGSAMGQASARLPVALGLTVVALLALVVAVLPIGFAIGSSGIDMAALQAGNPAAMEAITPGIRRFTALYGIALVLVMIWLGARLLPLNAVIANERRGLGSFARAFSLTRGLTWRLLGVTILFVIVLLVATSAAQLVTGIVFRLVLGADSIATATFLAGAAAAVVSTGFTILAYGFVARLWATLTAGEGTAGEGTAREGERS
jgi:hypothetical protein